MNYFYTFIVLLLVFIISQAFMSQSVQRTEQRKYTVISKDDQLEIRFYPEAILASVKMNGGKYSDVANNGFRTLAGYIFGGNKEKQRISMTAPVEMNMTDTVTGMSFVMPSDYSLSSLPTPNNESVLLHASPAEYVAVIGFSGYATDNKIEKYSRQLETLLKQRNINYHLPFRYFG